ncbi:MAG: hypothetical protein IIZ44_07910 [Muribaculaceae bacterium]|jgi:hypothetical protein|nr:hypothetical protein [Muribaculaceae bacterium]
MKRFTLLMAAIICLATSALAQVSENQTLSTTLWKQGIARCAHYTAYAKGFAKRSDEMVARFPQGYTLDDLNDVYENQGQKWEKIYNEFKKEENNAGSIADLKELVSPQIWKLVEPDFTAFITDHPDMMKDVPAQPEDQKADGEKVEGEQQEASQDEAAPANNANASSCDWSACAANLPLWLGILGTLLGLWALLTALSNRGKIKEMRRNFARELDRTNANLQEFSTDAADQMKALSIRLTGKGYRTNEAIAEEFAEEEAPEAAEQTNEVPQAVTEEEGEVMNLFMSKPDENDDFTRVSDTFEPGNSIYVLTTFDGQHGTFEVIDKPEVHRFALMMPAENLIRACSGNAIQIPSGTRIITDRAGEAEFIDGKWHVVVKAIIHYEG